MNLSTLMQSAKASVRLLAVEISLDSTQAINAVSQVEEQAEIKYVDEQNLNDNRNKVMKLSIEGLNFSTTYYLGWLDSKKNWKSQRPL